MFDPVKFEIQRQARQLTLEAEHFGFDYPHNEDERVYAHLKHVRLLPKNAQEMY